MEKNPKLSKIAIAYLYPVIQAAIYDCSDSMHDMEKLEAKFDALADDKFKIEKYIKKYHLDEYVSTIKKVIDDSGEEIDNWEEYLSNIPGYLPIEYKFYRNKLK